MVRAMASSGTAAVTGATGFIGSAVVRKLLEQKRSVRCLVEPGANTANLEGLPVESITCDVTDYAKMKKSLEGCETLYHLAAMWVVFVLFTVVFFRDDPASRRSPAPLEA